MKIFLTGGTGYIGAAILAALVRAGHEVTALSRSEERDRAITAAGARPLRGGLGQLAALVAPMAEQDALVHAAVDYTLGPDSDREAVAAMLQAAGQAGREVQVVYTSGVWVLGESPTPASENTPVIRPAAAVAHRQEVERRVLEAATARIATAVIRPGMVYGERRGLVNPLFESAREEGRAAFIGTGDQRWALVHRDDLAELYRLVIERRARGIFHGVDGESPKVSAIAAAASRAAGKGGAVRAIPVDEAREGFGPVADALAMDQVVISARAFEVGWKPAHPPLVADPERAFAELRG